MSDNPVLWSPTNEQIKNTRMYRFMQAQSCSTYDELYQWSIGDPAKFWRAIADFCGVQFTSPARHVLQQSGDMTTAKWFVGGELNFAEHLLRHRGEGAAIIFRGENDARREISFDELRASVAAVAAGLREEGCAPRGSGCRFSAELPRGDHSDACHQQHRCNLVFVFA